MASEAAQENIKFEFKDIENCAAKAEVTIAVEAVNDAYKAACKQAVKEAQLPGFRKGKAPLAIVKARYGSYIAEDVTRSLQQQGFSAVMNDKSKDIIGAGAPEEAAKVAENAAYTFTFPVEMAPEFELPEYKGLSVKLESSKDPEEAFKAYKDYMKGLYAEYVTIEDAAKEGDTLKVNYEADYPITEETSAAVKRMVKADETWLWLAEPEQIPGATKALTGAVKDGEYTFEAEFAADYRVADLAGKKLTYKVKVLEGQRRKPVESDEALAEKLNLKDVEEMNKNLRATSDRELAEAEKQEKKVKAVEKLLEAVADFELPKGILAQYTQREFSRIAESKVRKESDLEAFKNDREKYVEEAKKAAGDYLKRFFVLRKIAKTENLDVTPEEMQQRIVEMSQYLRKSVQEITELLVRNGGYEEVQNDMLSEKAAALVAENAVKE